MIRLVGRDGQGEHYMQTERQGAREQLVTALLEGQSWPQVSAGVCVPLKRAMAYRLLRAVRTKGKVALQDGRHGHPSKLRGEIRAFLETFCREAVHTPSFVIQKLLQKRFAVSVSISQLNRVRAQLGGSLHPRNQDQEKKRQKGLALHLNRSGSKVLGACCCLLPPIKRNS